MYMLSYMIFGHSLTLSPEVVMFLQSWLFDAQLTKITTTPRDEDPTLPENLPDIEVVMVNLSGMLVGSAPINLGYVSSADAMG